MRRLHHDRPHRQRLALALAPALALAFLPTLARAGRGKNKPKRKGGQAEVMVGASACIPGKGECKADGLGGTGPSVGMAFDIGWRAHPAFFLGAGYGIGWFNSSWKDLSGNREFRNAFQQGVFGILRAYVPVWRIDIGFELAPGWSRQTFVPVGRSGRDFSQGFALRPGLSLDIWLGKHLFIGAKVDTIFNFHGQVCHKQGRDLSCEGADNFRQARIHQLIGGAHVGGSF